MSAYPLHVRLCMELWREVQDHLDDVVTKELAALGAKPEHVSAYSCIRGMGMASFERLVNHLGGGSHDVAEQSELDILLASVNL